MVRSIEKRIEGMRMSACEMASAKSKNEALVTSTKVEKTEALKLKSAKERLLFCKCTC